MRKSWILLSVLALSVAHADEKKTQTFVYTGADQTFTVPSGCTSLTMKAWGGGGGSPGGLPGGGGGAYASSTQEVSPGEVLTIKVGGGGGIGVPGHYQAGGRPGAGGWPNGGAGGLSGTHPGDGGGGGGSSSVLKNGSVWVEAGGGAGGWYCAEIGNVGYGTYAGGSGQSSNGSCSPAGVQPGQSPVWGGCGGLGGAGGGYCGGAAVLGAGASHGGFSYGTAMVPGAGASAGNESEAPCNGVCGRGGRSNSAGQNGLVSLSW